MYDKKRPLNHRFIVFLRNANYSQLIRMIFINQ